MKKAPRQDGTLVFLSIFMMIMLPSELQPGKRQRKRHKQYTRQR